MIVVLPLYSGDKVFYTGGSESEVDSGATTRVGKVGAQVSRCEEIQGAATKGGTKGVG